MNRRIYPEIGACRALIVDANPASRGQLATMLRQMGVGQVTQATRAADARRALESHAFDIVLCDYHFDHSQMSGQELLDELREADLLPYSTVFVMVTGEASYARVAEAAEAALDGYLLKPHSATALEQRLLQARHRKKALRGIFEALEAGNFALAASQCAKRLQQRGAYWLYAARVGAELHIRLGQPDAARRVYEAVQATHALPWVRLGIARVQIESGQFQQALSTLEALIGEQPAYADAYDVMARVQAEAGDLSAALDTCRKATTLTPASIARLQQQGLLAFHAGAHEEAADAFERSVRIGLRSKMFDHQTLVLLALMQFDKPDRKALAQTHERLALAAGRNRESSRLRRFHGIASLLVDVLERGAPACIGQIGRLADGIRSDDFDFEAATHLLAVLARLHGGAIEPPDAPGWVDTLARRFCVSRAATEMLCLAVQGCRPYEAGIRAGQAAIGGIAEKAMAHSVTGSPLATVKALISQGEETRNAKLIELASLALNRHAAAIGDVAPHAQAIGELRRRYCRAGSVMAPASANGRAPGALTIRY